MRMFANHYADTPHGESHAPISTSVLLTALFVGAQWVLHVFIMVVLRRPDIVPVYADERFVSMSAVAAALLLVFLGFDFHRNRIEAHGRKRYQFAVFAVAALTLLAFLWYLMVASGWALSAS